MSPVAKVVIGVVLSIILIVIVCIAIVAYWAVSHKNQLSKLVEGPQKAIEEGKTYGRATDNDGCVDKAIDMEKADHSFGGAISNGVFLRGCLDSSKSTPNFCASVPKPTSIMDSAQWQSQQCKKRDPNDQYCAQLFQQVQQFCYVGH